VIYIWFLIRFQDFLIDSHFPKRGNPLKKISKQTKVFLYTKAQFVMLEYGLFAAMIIAVVTVVIVGMGSDLVRGVDYARNKTSCLIPGGVSDLPIATPAINNAAAMSSMVSTVTLCWLKSPRQS